MIQIEQEPDTSVSDAQKPDVLLLESRGELARLLQLYLDRLGFRALCASSSEEALKLWVDNKKTLSMFLSDWSQTRGLTPKHLVALFRMVKPSVRMIDTAPFVNFTYPREFNDQRKVVAVPHLLEAFRSILFEGANTSRDSGSGCGEPFLEQLVATN